LDISHLLWIITKKQSKAQNWIRKTRSGLPRNYASERIRNIHNIEIAYIKGTGTSTYLSIQHCLFSTRTVMGETLQFEVVKKVIPATALAMARWSERVLLAIMS
jgi:hypothetical protein